MKKFSISGIFLLLLIAFSSCRNKTVTMLAKKWDCVQVDNIIPPNTKLLTAKDSANAEQLKTVLLSLNWTFKMNMRYECAVNSLVTVKGKYKLQGDDKILVCTTDSKSVNRYIIQSLTEDDLVLTGNAENSNVVLHFKPH